MSEATVLVSEVQVKEGVSQKSGKPYKRVIVKDGNGEFYSSFEPGIFEIAKPLEGQRALIVYEQNGQFRNLEAIRPAEKKPEEKLGTGEYVKGQTAPNDARRILASVAWNCAAEMAKADLGFDAAKNIADKIFYDLLRKGELIADEDIPF